MSNDRIEFSLDRDRAGKYFFWQTTLILTFGFIFIFGLGLLLGLIYALFIGPWLCRQQAEALKYGVEGGYIRISCGVYFQKEKAIPLERVTDFALVQGPLMRYFGIWGLNIQTAGQGAVVAEGMLLAIDEPHATRDRLLKIRDEWVAGLRKAGAAPAA